VPNSPEQPSLSTPPPPHLLDIARLVASPNTEDRRRGLLALYRAPYLLDGVASFERFCRTAQEEAGWRPSLSAGDQTMFAQMSLIAELPIRIADLRNDPDRTVRRLAIKLAGLGNEHTRTGLSYFALHMRRIDRRWLLRSIVGVALLSAVGFIWLGWNAWLIPVGAVAGALYLRRVTRSAPISKHAA
jgi:hypothetical protein